MRVRSTPSPWGRDEGEFGLFSGEGRFGLLLVLFGLLFAGAAPAQPDAEAWRAYRQAEANLKAQPEDAKRAWEFGRACFDLAEVATNNTQRAAIADKGIAACRQALERDPKSAPAHYYLGLDLGQLARTRGLSALRIIKEMEGEWLRAAELDSQFDHAGPERSLGMLYRDAPSFASIGSRSKARQQLMRAIELAPNYPENRFELIETYLKWNDGQSARHELQALEDVWSAANDELKGPEWAASWKEWEVHLQKLKKRVGESAKLETPRH